MDVVRVVRQWLTKADPGVTLGSQYIAIINSHELGVAFQAFWLHTLLGD